MSVRSFLVLTEANVLDYLRAREVLAGPARAECLGGGVSNLVLRIETSDDCFVVKQSCPQLRTKDAWFSDLERIYREQEVMQALGPHLPAPVVPRVRFVDREHFVYAMDHALREAQVWKSELLADMLNPALARRAGQILGAIHETSARRRGEFEVFADHRVFVQLRVDPFYRRIQERRPEVAEAVGKIIEEMLGIREALCHGDFTPKNLLAHAGEFTLVDYETAHFGDPTMDLGLFTAHLVLKSLRRDSLRDGFIALLETFWQGYAASVGFAPVEWLERRGVRHAGVCLLARVDGTSPVDYLTQESQRASVRDLGRAILFGDVRTWRELFAMLRGR